MANRTSYVTSALVILRAFRGMDNAALVPPLGSFESWTHAIVDPVAWVTGENPLDVRVEIKSHDRGSQLRVAMIEGWAELPGAEDGLTVAQGLEMLKAEATEMARYPSYTPKYSTLRSALLELSNTGDLPTAKSIGRHFKAMEGRVIGDVYVRSIPSRTGIMKWKIERIPTP